MELIVEDSMLVDNNTTIPTKQIVIKVFYQIKRFIKQWSIEKFKKICFNISI